MDRLMEVPDTTVPPTSALVRLVCFYKVEKSERGRVLGVSESRGLSVGFQVKNMPRHVFTAGHGVETLKPDPPGTRVLTRREAPLIYALGIEQFKKMSQAQWYDVSVLEQLGAQQVLSFRSEYPSTGQQLERQFGGDFSLYGDLDVALLRLAGPLSGVVGLPLAPFTTKFRPGALFLAIGTPPMIEETLGVHSANAFRVPVYSANQDLRAEVTLSGEAITFDRSSVSYMGFSGGPICARLADVVAPSFLEVLARPIEAFLPMVELPPGPAPPPTTRKAREILTAVDPITGEDLRYPTGELASPTYVCISFSSGLVACRCFRQAGRALMIECVFAWPLCA